MLPWHVVCSAQNVGAVQQLQGEAYFNDEIRLHSGMLSSERPARSRSADQ
jgi:hypothetical protein